MSQFDCLPVLAELDAGVFSHKLSRAMSDVALGVVEHGRKGKVVIELSVSRIGESSQVAVEHKLKYEKPTRRGRTTEEDTTETALYVERGGALAIVPSAQTKLFED